MLIRFAALLVVLPALLVTGCSEGFLPLGGCTELGCASSFSIEFQRQSAWKPGAYSVKATVDGKPFTCSATIPLSCNAPDPCPADAPFLLGLSGCAQDPSQHSLSGIEVLQGSAPASIDIEIAQDGSVIGTGTFKPTYTTSRPNGPGCEPICESAPSAKLTLP